jgi:hypothetical protein
MLSSRDAGDLASDDGCCLVNLWDPGLGLVTRPLGILESGTLRCGAVVRLGFTFCYDQPGKIPPPNGKHDLPQKRRKTSKHQWQPVAGAVCNLDERSDSVGIEELKPTYIDAKLARSGPREGVGNAGAGSSELRIQCRGYGVGVELVDLSGDAQDAGQVGSGDD